MNGAYFESYDLARVREYFKNKFRNNIYEDIEIKFSDKVDFDAFLYDYLQKDNPYIYDDISDIKRFYYGRISVSSEYSNTSNYAKISVKFEN